MTAQLDKVLHETRTLGRAVGFQYPRHAPEDVVLGPRKHPNHLAYTTGPSFTLPHLTDVLDGCKSLTPEDADIIRKNVQINNQVLEGYREKQVTNVMKLYDVMADSIITVDAMLGFYLELYAHCDGQLKSCTSEKLYPLVLGSLRDLVHTKLSGLFKPHLRDMLQGSDMPR